MQRRLRRRIGMGFLLGAGQAFAATISVDITADEDNGNTMGPEPLVPAVPCVKRCRR